MKVHLYMFMVLAVSAASCLKKDTGCSYQIQRSVAPASEEQAIQAYLSSNNITATRHSSNLYYEVVSAGSGNAPDLCNTVLVKYSGKLTNGTEFDSQANAVFVLGSLIDGWKIGVPLIKKGGQIRLYIPPSLGYGSNDIKNNSGVVIIPGNSILIFDITLTDLE